MSYMQKRAGSLVGDYRQALGDLAADTLSLEAIDWATVPDDKLEGIMPLLESFAKMTGNAAMAKLIVAMIMAVVEAEA